MLEQLSTYRFGWKALDFVTILQSKSEKYKEYSLHKMIELIFRNKVAPFNMIPFMAIFYLLSLDFKNNLKPIQRLLAIDAQVQPQELNSDKNKVVSDSFILSLLNANVLNDTMKKVILGNINKMIGLSIDEESYDTPLFFMAVCIEQSKANLIEQKHIDTLINECKHCSANAIRLSIEDMYSVQAIPFTTQKKLSKKAFNDYIKRWNNPGDTLRKKDFRKLLTALLKQEGYISSYMNTLNDMLAKTDEEIQAEADAKLKNLEEMIHWLDKKKDVDFDFLLNMSNNSIDRNLHFKQGKGITNKKMRNKVAYNNLDVDNYDGVGEGYTTETIIEIYTAYFDYLIGGDSKEELENTLSEIAIKEGKTYNGIGWVVKYLSSTPLRDPLHYSGAISSIINYVKNDMIPYIDSIESSNPFPYTIIQNRFRNLVAMLEEHIKICDFAIEQADKDKKWALFSITGKRVPRSAQSAKKVYNQMMKAMNKVIAHLQEKIDMINVEEWNLALQTKIINKAQKVKEMQKTE